VAGAEEVTQLGSWRVYVDKMSKKA